MPKSVNDMTTADFLRKIIAPEGVPQVTSIQNGKAKNLPCTDVDHMATRIATIESNGANAYHACATFHDGKSRVAGNAKSMQSFYLDIDCGETKRYATKIEAFAALKDFCRQTGLPRPMIVDSGGGLHVYWPLEAPIPANQWKVTAKQLKELTASLGFNVDHAVTADAARVLRPVGSFNKKYDPPHEVTLLKDAEPVDFQVFSACVAAGNIQHPGTMIAVHGKVGDQDVAALVNPNCYQISEVEEALTRLNPWCGRGEWMPIGMALADAYGEDARDLFVRWSRGDLWEGEQ